MRAPESQRDEVSSIRDLQIYSPAADRMIPIRQVVRGFETVFEDGLIFKRNRRPTITLHADQTDGESAIPFERIRGPIEAWFAEAKRCRDAWLRTGPDSGSQAGSQAGDIP